MRKTEVEYVCPPGTSCRNAACNCDDLPDNTVMGNSYNYSSEKRECRRVAGQKCSVDSECFHYVQCVKGVCTCNETRKDEDPSYQFYCVYTKNDAMILQ